MIKLVSVKHVGGKFLETEPFSNVLVRRLGGSGFRGLRLRLESKVWVSRTPQRGLVRHLLSTRVNLSLPLLHFVFGYSQYWFIKGP